MPPAYLISLALRPKPFELRLWKVTINAKELVQLLAFTGVPLFDTLTSGLLDKVDDVGILERQTAYHKLPTSCTFKTIDLIWITHNYALLKILTRRINL